MTTQTPAIQPSRVFAFSLSFFWNRHLRGMLAAHGLRPRFGLPGPGDKVLVWGRKPVARRGQAIARARGAQVVTLEDGFLRSIRTGREGDPAHGMVVDRRGIYFDTSQDSDLRHLMDAVAEAGPVPEAAPLLAQWRDSGLSKYNAHTDVGSDLPDDYVLVVDQTFGDASVAGAGAHAGTFQLMLDAARRENPGATILIKAHPETTAGKRGGYFDAGDAGDGVRRWTAPTAPKLLFSRARAIYCVSSGLGFEAILHGHRPVVFGDAFYAGRGLTYDRHPRTVALSPLTVEGLFDATMLRYSRWYDPILGRATDPGTVIDQLSDLRRSAERTRPVTVMVAMRLWKRGFLRRMFPGVDRFDDDPVRAAGRAAAKAGQVIVWAGKEDAALRDACADARVALWRMEDGFIRSSGLGADLIAPSSLALDDLGIYYDAARPSRLETLIGQSPELSAAQIARAKRLREAVTAAGVSKYNLAPAPAEIGAVPGQEIILVPGQVEDDQSILKGADKVRTNADLMAAARATFPDAWLIFKSHPDVVAGLRAGGEPPAMEGGQILRQGDMAGLLGRVDRVVTMTSLTGFEALLRGVPVTTFGAPFYAGWGLTDDRGEVPDRRGVQVALDGLVHAALIGYPLYWDPVSGMPCRAETLVERLAAGASLGRRGPVIRLLAKAQGMLASWAHLWRR